MTDAPSEPAETAAKGVGARIEVKGLGKAYIHNGQALQVLSDVDLVLPPGGEAVTGATHRVAARSVVVLFARVQPP